MTFRKSLRLSFIGHILFMWLATGMPIGCAGGGEGSEAEKQEQAEEAAKQKEKTEQIADKDGPDEVEVTIVNRPVEKSEEQIAWEKAQEFIENCEPYFGGIGITHNGQGIVETAHKYYPAHTAGIRKGDRILNLGDMRGPVGSEVTVRIVRDGQEMLFRFKRGRICLEEIKK